MIAMQERRSELLALHKQGKVEDKVLEGFTEEVRQRYRLFHYNRAAMIFYTINLEMELFKEQPREEIIVKSRMKIESFAQAAKEYM